MTSSEHDFTISQFTEEGSADEWKHMRECRKCHDRVWTDARRVVAIYQYGNDPEREPHFVSRDWQLFAPCRGKEQTMTTQTIMEPDHADGYDREAARAYWQQVIESERDQHHTHVLAWYRARAAELDAKLEAERNYDRRWISNRRA